MALGCQLWTKLVSSLWTKVVSFNNVENVEENMRVGVVLVALIVVWGAMKRHVRGKKMLMP